VERTAKASRLSESEVARKAIQLAHEGAATVKAGSRGDNGGDRASHVGYYLIDKGLPQLERAAEARLSSAEAVRRTACRFPLILYLGAIALLTLAFAGNLLDKAYAGGLHGWMLALIAILLVLCTSHLASALVNWAATLLAAPRPLPRLDFSTRIPPECRTLVVVPTMLTSAQNLEDLVEALEVRFLANRDDHLHFGLLTDFRDAREETLPEDEALLLLARNRIEELNEKYRTAASGADSDAFFLFHRPRRWNPQDGLWMGYERKRGKLAELNSLLRGGVRDSFSLIVGTTDVLSSVKYVITLDTDTQLPRDSARQFVGAMAHPLNRAQFDEARQLVTEGYGILQPRVAV
ncbi:MAG: cyclic beta 1-2 glucan synthetase, partial [Burkholderiales bacterium]|nr:cyclic beta 1-2 glucan synthetase [Burkholderiales bacterium]